jgi:hypothetical protein
MSSVLAIALTLLGLPTLAWALYHWQTDWGFELGVWWLG